MTKFIKVVIPAENEATQEILIAQLSEIGYQGFEEKESQLFAYIATGDFDLASLKAITDLEKVKIEDVPEENWNAVWESNFEPVVIDDFCTIRAHFHDIKVVTRYDILITPKMSFGTGHHATTRSVIRLMRTQDLKEKVVLDFGTGTGVLGILASMMGAERITGIDNDEWCYTNAVENIENNAIVNFAVVLGELEVVENDTYDVVLANINRNILLKYMEKLREVVKNNGCLLLSGILMEDKEVIVESATINGFKLNAEISDNNWLALLFTKN